MVQFVELDDPDDNGVIYSEKRPMIDLNNDVDRLVSHFLV